MPAIKLLQFGRRICDLYDRLDSAPNRHRLEQLVVIFSAAGFVVHLFLIFLARSNQELGSGILAGVGKDYLHAVYTPFSFILFYEVLMLVLALPGSLTSSIGKQYEIISLIVVRRVFKDIGAFDEVGWLAQTDALRMILLDMGGALLMFLSVGAFYRIRMTVVRSSTQRDLEGFIAIKKGVAVLLGAVLILLAANNLVTWLLLPLPFENPFMAGPADSDGFFFPAFFEFMIFTDVFLLIISISYYDRYEYVFRNAGFIISTVLLRVSLSTQQPYDLAIALVAMLYGLSVIVVFSYCTHVFTAKRKEAVGAAVDSASANP